MNRLWSYLGALVLTVSVGWAGEPAKTTLKVEGMTCGGCVAAMKVQLKRTEGVTAYEVSLEKAEGDDPASAAVQAASFKDGRNGADQTLCLNPSRLTRETLALLERKS